MIASSEKKIATKIFIGFELSMEIRTQLGQCANWKQDQVSGKLSENDLSVVKYKEKEYVGRYIAYSTLPVKDVKKEAAEVSKKLASYCPELDVDQLTVQIFPQVFVS